MEILYRSTRGPEEKALTASQAILQGLAPDGGLFVPVDLPQVELNFAKLINAPYQEVAYQILHAFLTDFTEQELRDCINKAYDKKFTTPAIAPLKKSEDGYFLELFHGPTLAFKDMALSILPYLMTTAAKKNHLDKEIVILTATSGDTGKAAMAGFADVPGTSIIVFYPKDGVSSIQKQQMVTQTGANTHVVGIDGNFDQAQTNVKKIFNDTLFRKQLAAKDFQFSSANSINIGRLVPQIAYYVFAYAQLLKKGAIKNGDKVNFSVPTGNFGNILAAYYAKAIGLPIGKLICASNKNNVLTDFFNSGVYDKNRPFYVTTSPSMDILVSSNLERLIFQLSGKNDQQTRIFMQLLNETGNYQVNDNMRRSLDDFYADYASELETTNEINRVFRENQYTIDPHTAVASAVARKYHEATGDKALTVVVSTASPFKFPNPVLQALSGKAAPVDGIPADETLASFINLPLPKPIEQLRSAPVLHKQIVEPNAMQEAIAEILGV
ncbi:MULTISPECIES: threonine synthase [Loigolactobacillus]|uniref:Threonine synthase n=1 Tax=Loigolactobacillus backii TaxID=375175 RepID=A0A192GZQ1_9LACO|nr:MULTISPECIES: threonine synthase [Loigolactobacillus]ANK60487.1 threonine synthase [Loigolactobacillus backii]ANK62014.1 threonine synthase [Loigolactobacillus backii]ANK65369.1 threonine synthase [Loigolactobacillus backii]ANK67917.1 threonine synthase [Loigolactobacillus backii]ANK68792.1 threonine synthase [Loigolactobacillus backii]